MDWVRLMIMGDVGQQADIENIEATAARLRHRLATKRTVDQSQDEALLILRRELTELQLVVGELARLLVAGGAVPAEAVEQIVRGVERSRGADAASDRR